MICDECKKEGKISTIQIGPSIRTLMNYQNYYDEKGFAHFHDPNIDTTIYQCSNGHTWYKKTRMGECRCGWKAEEESK